MSKEFWIAMGIISCCFITAMFTKILIGYEKPPYQVKDFNTSLEKRILILETKMAVLLEEREKKGKGG